MKLLSESSFAGSRQPASGNLITLHNSNGLVAQFTNYGARWVSMWVPDRNGEWGDVILGFDSLSGYHSAGEKYHGAIVGRVCGRIDKACFSLHGKEYLLAENDAYGEPRRNHLHGGIHAFHNRMWESRLFINAQGEEGIAFSTFSADGEEGYPGNLQVEIIYTLSEANSLIMECRASTDKPTPVNLTNHVFFNLQGGNNRMNIGSHRLTIYADHLIECDPHLIPTGKLVEVADTSLDFRKARRISSAFKDKKIQENKGFSVAFALNTMESGLAATLEEDNTGRKVEIFTNQPSLQVYNGYFMDGSDIGKQGTRYYASAGIALETQGFPDAPNHPGFPSVVIDSDNPYYHLTTYRFTLSSPLIPSKQ